MPAEVSFQMAAFGVHLPTAWVGALMDPLCRWYSGHPGGHGPQQTVALGPNPSHTRYLDSPHGDGQRGNLHVLLVR